MHHFQCLTVPVELPSSIENDAHGIEKASAKNSSKLNKFLHSDVNLLIQHNVMLEKSRPAEK